MGSTNSFIDLIFNDSKSGGHVFASCAPGKIEFEKGVYRDLVEDIESIKRENISVVVSLIEDFEFEQLLIEEFPNYVLENNINFIHYPIIDHQIPTNIKTFNLLIVHLCNLFLNGHRILIHCRGGVGRTGTVCACMLLHFGYSPKIAIETVKSRRRRALRNQSQCRFIHYYQSRIITTFFT